MNANGLSSLSSTPSIYPACISRYLLQNHKPCLGVPLVIQPSDTCKLFVDDLRVLSAASVEARSSFEQNRYISPSSTEAEQKVLKAKEVARVLRQNVVQGEQVTGSEDKEQRYRA